MRLILILFILLGIIPLISIFVDQSRDGTPVPGETAVPDLSTGPRVVWVKTSFVTKGENERLFYELRLDDHVTVTVKSQPPPKAAPGAPAPVALPSGEDRSLDAWISRVKGTSAPADVLRNLVVYINGIPVKGCYPVGIDRRAFQAEAKGTETTEFRFHLRRTGEKNNREAWVALLGRPGTAGAHMPVALTLGTESGNTLMSDFIGPGVLAEDKSVQLRVVASWWWALLGEMLVLLILFVHLARTTDIIRDTDCQPDEGKQRPYSLSRLQMALWLVMVTGFYLLIWMVTRDWSVLPNGILILMGLSSATTVGALLIDKSKRETRLGLQVKIAKLEELAKNLASQSAADPPPANAAELDERRREALASLAGAHKELEALPQPSGNTDGFLKDILNDGSGVSLHRLQVLVWTGVFLLIFTVSAWRSLAMPDFEPGLLALMGISAGTYLGFKGIAKDT